MASNVTPFPNANTPGALAAAAFLEGKRLDQMIVAAIAVQAALGDFVSEAIAVLDAVGGDCDLEEMDAEDSFVFSPQVLSFAPEGPGCSISDPGGCEHDGREHEDGE